MCFSSVFIQSIFWKYLTYFIHIIWLCCMCILYYLNFDHSLLLFICIKILFFILFLGILLHIFAFKNIVKSNLWLCSCCICCCCCCCCRCCYVQTLCIPLPICFCMCINHCVLLLNVSCHYCAYLLHLTCVTFHVSVMYYSICCIFFFNYV